MYFMCSTVLFEGMFIYYLCSWYLCSEEGTGFPWNRSKDGWGTAMRRTLGSLREQASALNLSSVVNYLLDGEFYSYLFSTMDFNSMNLKTILKYFLSYRIVFLLLSALFIEMGSLSHTLRSQILLVLFVILLRGSSHLF